MIINVFILACCVLSLVLPIHAENYFSPDGFKFAVNLNQSKKTIMLGEPTYIDFEVKNLSQVELEVLWGGDYRNEFGRHESFNVEITDSNKRIITKPKTLTRGGLIGFRKIPVNQVFNFRLYLPHWGKITNTGDYKVSVRKNLVVRKREAGNNNVPGNSNGVPIELIANVKVEPINYRKMGEIVNSIGWQFVRGDNTARKLVPFIEDKRIVKYLIEAAEKEPALLRHLSKFNDDQAFNAIIGKIKDSDDNVQRNVSSALSQSVHPKAFVQLLRMRNDTSAAIRLSVVHFLGKTKTAESTRLLKTMLNDRDTIVSNESKRYLTERGENFKQ